MYLWIYVLFVLPLGCLSLCTCVHLAFIVAFELLGITWTLPTSRSSTTPFTAPSPSCPPIASTPCHLKSYVLSIVFAHFRIAPCLLLAGNVYIISMCTPRSPAISLMSSASKLVYSSPSVRPSEQEMVAAGSSSGCRSVHPHLHHTHTHALSGYNFLFACLSLRVSFSYAHTHTHTHTHTRSLTHSLTHSCRSC
jgi:hypothetical protein